MSLQSLSCVRGLDSTNIERREHPHTLPCTNTIFIFIYRHIKDWISMNKCWKLLTFIAMHCIILHLLYVIETDLQPGSIMYLVNDCQEQQAHAKHSPGSVNAKLRKNQSHLSMLTGRLLLTSAVKSLSVGMSFTFPPKVSPNIPPLHSPPTSIRSPALRS